jgi:hypothetical protein
MLQEAYNSSTPLNIAGFLFAFRLSPPVRVSTPASPFLTQVFRDIKPLPENATISHDRFSLPLFPNSPFIIILTLLNITYYI